MSNKYDDYAVQDAANTMMKAEEHKADPKMMGLVTEHLKKKKHAIHKITSVKQLRAVKAKMEKEPDPNDPNEAAERAAGEE